MEMTRLLYHVIRCVMEIIKEVVVMKYIIGYGAGARTKYRRVGVSFVLVVVALFLACRFVPDNIMAILYVPIVLVCFTILTERMNIPRLLLSLIAYVCICEVDFFLTAIAEVFSLQMITGVWMERIIANGIGMLILIAVGYACYYFDISFYKQSIGRRKMFLVVEIFVLFINIGIISIMFAILSEQKGLQMQLLLLVAMLLSLLLSVVILMFYCVVNTNQEYKQINELNLRYLDAQRNHYERMKQKEVNTRKFRHDIDNHTIALKGLMMDGKYQEAEQYLEEIVSNLNKIKSPVRTGNDIVDAIVHEKYEKAKEHGIDFEIKGVFSERLMISNYDICTILGNALDNALEASQKVQRKRYVCMEIRSHQNMLHLMIRNSMAGKSDLSTTKTDRRYHGFGLDNLKQCVEKNMGQVEITQTEEEFCLDIVIAAYKSL